MGIKASHLLGDHMTPSSASTEGWDHQGLCMGRDPKVPTSFLCGFGFDSYNVFRRGPLNMLISVPPSWSLSTLVCGGLYVHLCEPTCVCVGVCTSVHPNMWKPEVHVRYLPDHFPPIY